MHFLSLPVYRIFEPNHLPWFHHTNNIDNDDINKTKCLLCTRKTIHPTYIKTGEEQFEQVNSFKYVGTMVNTDNSIEEEIKGRISAGNRTYHVHKKLFSSKLISRNVKLQLYNTIIRPTVTYASRKIWQTDGFWKKDHEENIWSYKNRWWLLEN